MRYLFLKLLFILFIIPYRNRLQSQQWQNFWQLIYLLGFLRHFGKAEPKIQLSIQQILEINLIWFLRAQTTCAWDVSQGNCCNIPMSLSVRNLHVKRTKRCLAKGSNYKHGRYFRNTHMNSLMNWKSLRNPSCLPRFVIKTALAEELSWTRIIFSF